MLTNQDRDLLIFKTWFICTSTLSNMPKFFSKRKTYTWDQCHDMTKVYHFPTTWLKYQVVIAHLQRGIPLEEGCFLYVCVNTINYLLFLKHISAPIPQSPISHWDPMSEETSRIYQWKEKSRKKWRTSTLLRRLSMLKSKRGLTAASFIDKNCTATHSSPTMVEELCPISEQ